MLRAAGAPELPNSVADDIVLMTGTLWHSWANEALLHAGVPVMQEVKLKPWMPEGWSGTADWIFYVPEYRAFKLGDLKTIKGDGIQWVLRDGAKDAHRWQLSSYWHALYDMGLPLLEEFDVLYWPKDRGPGNVEPTVQSVVPLRREELQGTMTYRWLATKRYLAALYPSVVLPDTEPDYLNEWLPPVQDRVQVVTWNKPKALFDLKLKPHWSAQFCPFPAELCDCRQQGETKIGHYTLSGSYVPRKGWEHFEPVTTPTEAEYRRRNKENS